jgi:hypothetical protein
MRTAIITTPDTSPVRGDFPEPTVPSGLEPLLLVGAGLYNTVRGRPPGGTTATGR